MRQKFEIETRVQLALMQKMIADKNEEGGGWCRGGEHGLGVQRVLRIAYCVLVVGRALRIAYCVLCEI